MQKYISFFIHTNKRLIFYKNRQNLAYLTKKQYFCNRFLPNANRNS